METINYAEKALAALNLTDEQKQAAAERARDVVLTAGAGSGKTRTLVARYLSLLADGIQPENLLAITFTEKAANEMRARIRKELHHLVQSAAEEMERSFWRVLERQMDAARIGTIHSLCAEVIRMHPALAGVDPQFQMMDEGRTTILRREVAAETLAEAIQEPVFLLVFEAIKPRSLEQLLVDLLENRLALGKWQPVTGDPWQLIHDRLSLFFESETIRSCIEELQELKHSGTLSTDTTPKGKERVEDLLVSWREVSSPGTNGLKSCQILQTIRRPILSGNLGKKDSRSTECLQTMRDLYDQQIEPWLGKDSILGEAEEQAVVLADLLRVLFRRAEEKYHAYLAREHALDFDDLEQKALYLLTQPQVSEVWQGLAARVLVDEFQDTNQRQREIVEAICGGRPGTLFVVGDARQSIYRFRGADVTVFQIVQQRTQLSGGLLLNLDQTFRTHSALLTGMEPFLAQVMGVEQDAQQPFRIPFTPMKSDKQAAETTTDPYLELLIGSGEDTAFGREAAAAVLAERLWTLKESGEIVGWQDVALLFRATTVFPVYEEALEKAGIPYVSVAGSGFYDRPEIRDILNLLRALADPWDDLGMMGFLRSPAVGMRDFGIYQLRWGSGDKGRSLHLMVTQRNWEGLSEEDQLAAEKAAQLLEKLGPLVGRVTVAEIIRQLLAETFYYAVLAGGEERVWRNVDKLMQDPYAQQTFSIHAYLEILEQLRVTGAREGEAPGEAGDAVQLMSIHKAKGLEFPVVVLADAGRQARISRDRWLPVSERGIAVKPDLWDYTPLPFRVASMIESEQEEAESNRLFYVAATRVKEKLILNGHFSKAYGKAQAKGWLKEVLAVLGLEAEELVNQPLNGDPVLPNGQTLRVQLSELFPVIRRTEQKENTVELQDEDLGGLIQSLPVNVQKRAESQPGKRSLLPDPSQAPSQEVIGKILHRAMQFWFFTDQPGLDAFLRQTALEFGVIDEKPQQVAVEKVSLYLERFLQSALYETIHRAKQRFHEIPYSFEDEPLSDSGRLDILFQTDEGWWIIDFKTDAIDEKTGLDDFRHNKYTKQLQRYQTAVERQMKHSVNAAVCFLDYGGKIVLFPLNNGTLVK